MASTTPVVAGWILLLVVTGAAGLADAGAVGSHTTSADQSYIGPDEFTRGVFDDTSHPGPIRSATTDVIPEALHDPVPSLATGPLAQLRASLESLSQPALVLLAGYSRYDDSDPLALETRRTLYETVTESPGRSLAQLSDETGVSVSTVRYHSRVLVEEGLARTEPMNGRHRVFPTAHGSDALAAALADDGTAAILHAVAKHGPINVSSLADEVDRAPSTVSYHLDRLETDGLVVRERAGPAVNVTVPPAVALPDGGH